ncbi:MAG: hypothetical protein OXN15_01390 [Chloroflexota bacterium]|nr:hypothetical protein [Chloroflexota bacterium]MDE2968835.1 hypothetical protein [Chloroflexota bacterium]
MAFFALITGTLFWLVVFFCLMAAAYVFIRDDFGFKGVLEAAIFIGLMVVVGMPLHMIARRLSGRAIAAAGETASAESTGAAPDEAASARRRRRRRGRR